MGLVAEEVPTIVDTTYLLTPAAAMKSDIGEGVGPVGSDSLVIFCIDTSGSMCVTTEVREIHCTYMYTGIGTTLYLCIYLYICNSTCVSCNTVECTCVYALYICVYI